MNEHYYTFPPENDKGCIEYKWNLSTISKYKFNKTVTQMRWRVLEESDNKSCLYVLGVHDNGNLVGLSLKDLSNTFVNLMDCASTIGMNCCLRFIKKVSQHDSKYWAVMQVFDGLHQLKTSNGIIEPPLHEIPSYFII